MKNRNRKWRWKRKSFVIAGKSSLCLLSFPFFGEESKGKETARTVGLSCFETDHYQRVQINDFPGPWGPVFHRLGFLLSVWFFLKGIKEKKARRTKKSETQDRDQMGLRRFLFASCPIFSVPILYFLSLPCVRRERKMGTEKGQMLLKRKRRRRESLAGGLGRKEQKQQELTPAFCTWSLGAPLVSFPPRPPSPPETFPCFPSFTPVFSYTH